jgi:serine/threonine-protein kinase
MGDGLSTFYEAFDVSRGEDVWVKAVSNMEGTRQETVVHEYGTLAALEHLRPRVPRVYELFVGEEETAFSTERFEGAELAVRRGAPEPGTVALLAQLVRTLELVHGSGIVHRDVIPGNVIVTPEHRLN